MRIKTFCKFVEVSELESLTLQNTTIVVDGQNFFYNSYDDSGLPYKLGGESHRYASYLREQLAMFKKANVKCYFVFKGGHVNMAKRLEKVKDQDNPSISPVFMKTVYKEVLDEMGFPYVVCEYESKKDIIELAQKLDCPVVSYDIEFCFSGLKYIPRNELKFNERDAIDCRVFTLDEFLRKYKLTAEKIAIFIALTDENIFPENFFSNFFRHIKSPLSNYQRNLRLLFWLSKNSKENILTTVAKFVSAEDKKKFDEEVGKAELMIGRREKGGLGAAYLLDREAAAVARGDPNWFAKGVAGNHVAINYVNLYRYKHFFGSIGLEPTQDDPMLLSLDVLKYAYDLLTDFQNEGFSFVYDTTLGREFMIVSATYSIRKPEYEANVCVFENGWSEVCKLGLFQHFLKETVQLNDLSPLERVPADVRLLLIALVYFSRKKLVDTSAEATCVLLSYVTLNIVQEKCDKANLPKFPFAPRPILDASTDKDTVTVADCNIAAAIMAGFLSTSNSTAEYVLDREMLEPLVEFQHCLRQLNDLNALCGAPYVATTICRTFAGSLVYRLRRAEQEVGDVQRWLDALLSPAPTVYAFLSGLIEVYEEM